MLSTLLAYRMYTADPDRTLARLEANASNKREADYYAENIGTVSSVDEFLGNYRLYSFAMKAYGLEEQINQQGFMRKVLESDLSDSASFANRLVDKKFVTFAKAFAFDTDGSVSGTVEVQSASQENDTVEAYSEARVRRATSTLAETNHFKKTFAATTTVDDFLADQRIYEVALKAYGIDPTYLSKSYVRSALTADRSDEAAYRSGVANQKFLDLAKALAFDEDGTATLTDDALDAQIEETIYQYNEKTGNGDSAQALQYKTDYFKAHIDAINDVTALAADSKLTQYVLTAFGLDPDLESVKTMQLALTSDLDDPKSYVNRMSEASTSDKSRKLAYKAMAAMFDFASDGSVTGDGPITAAEKEELTGLYREHHDDASETEEKLDTAIFRGKIRKVSDINDLLYDSSLLDFALTAYDIEPGSVSRVTLRKILTSDVSDPKSYANRSGDDRYRNLAAAFNFDAAGKLSAQQTIQSTKEQQALATRYTSSIDAGAPQIKKNEAKAEATYYLETVSRISSLDEFVADDRLTSFVLTAYGLENEKVSSEMMKRVLTSDLSDSGSYVYTLDSRFAEIAGVFNFEPDGTVTPTGSQAQTRGNIVKTREKFFQQTLELEAGEQSEGARLALYLKRIAPTLNSAYDILADKATFEAVRTALGLPEQMSQADLDLQAKILEKEIDFDDFQDEKKLDAFIARFATMYDLKNDTSSSSPVLTLLGGGESSGLLAYL
ncbi:DUF1217 domain-containing protein [Consotaella aegiceratis]|uniref:DUF1217 domain-containing protein n=1 Tax=Consotaella aegiceratis TaxID=3097961 RepID=UPI002F3FB983